MGGEYVRGTAYSYAPEKNLGQPDCQTPRTLCGNPINVTIGNKFQVEPDLKRGDGRSIELSRYYNSHNAVATTHIGRHWRHTFDRSIDHMIAGSVEYAVVFRPDGKSLKFSPPGAGGNVWLPDVDQAQKLEVYRDGAGAVTGWVFLGG